jgi:hypothetical protein
MQQAVMEGRSTLKSDYFDLMRQKVLFKIEHICCLAHNGGVCGRNSGSGSNLHSKI